MTINIFVESHDTCSISLANSIELYYVFIDATGMTVFFARCFALSQILVGPCSAPTLYLLVVAVTAAGPRWSLLALVDALHSIRASVAFSSGVHSCIFWSLLCTRLHLLGPCSGVSSFELGAANLLRWIAINQNICGMFCQYVCNENLCSCCPTERVSQL